MAYFNHVNENGGVLGRKVVLQLYDDGYQPVPAVNNTVNLIVEDEVFTLFGYVGTPTVNRVLPLLKKFQAENFQLFFPFTGAQAQREPPYGEFAFNLRASYRQETAGLVDNLIATGRTRIAMFYQADAYGRSGWAGVRMALAQHDLSIVGEATYQRGTRFTADLRPQAQILAAAKPDAIICIGAYAACAAFLRDAVDTGLTIPIANLSFVGSEKLVDLITDSQADPNNYTRWLLNSQVVPSYVDSSFPAVAEYIEHMARYSPGLPSQFADDDYLKLDKSFVSLEGFLNAKVLTEVFRRLGDSPKREDISTAVYSIDDFDVGINEYVSFSATKRQGLDKVYFTVVDDNQFVLIEDWDEAFG